MGIRITREVKLAATAIIALVILIWGINFLKAKSLFDRNSVFYGVYDRVDGLKVSSGVVYRGYNVGQVTAISFAGEHFDKVLVQFSVGKKLEIPKNSIAVIQNADLMGSKVIDLKPGDAMQYAQSGDTLKTLLELGVMEQLNEQLQPLKQKANNIMSSLDTILVSINEMFDNNGSFKGGFNSLGRTLENIEGASGELNRLLARESSRISDILANINSITGNLERSNIKISRSLNNVTDISDSLRSVNINKTIRSLNNILGQIGMVLSEINAGKGTIGKAVNDDELYYNLVLAGDNLNKLLVELNTNPKRFVHFSLFDFSSDKEKGQYGIVIAESDKSLPLDDKIYVENSDLEEIRSNGRYLYVIDTYKKLQQAEKQLPAVKKKYKNAFIVKMP